MTSERIKEIQETTAYPNSVSVKQALLQVWNECAQEQSRQAAVSGSLPTFKVVKVDRLKRGDFFLWQGRDGVQEIHQYHSDAGYGVKTFTDYSELDESSMLVNWSGVVGKIEVGGNDH